MNVKLIGGTRDGQVMDLDPIDDENGRWIEFADTNEYYSSQGQLDEYGNEIFDYQPDMTGPLST